MKNKLNNLNLSILQKLARDLSYNDDITDKEKLIRFISTYYKSYGLRYEDVAARYNLPK